MTTEDPELLRSYAEDHAEAAFAEIVRRHVDFVYSAALRQMNGDAHLAQDVTQLVFADLARKAAALARHRVLAGWLFTSTRYAAAKLVRGERRRRVRETEAELMREILHEDGGDALDWSRVRPVLDEALAELGDADREAVLLRFFEGRDYAGAGARLGLGENAARMRVKRAVDKLRSSLDRRGVKSSTAALAVALGGQAVVAAPAGLAATVTGAALAGGGAVAAGAGAGAWVTFMSMTKLHVGISGALAVAGVTALVLQAQNNAGLSDEIAGLRQENQTLAVARAENVALRRTAAEVAALRDEGAQLDRLDEETVALKGRMQQVARQAAARAAVVERATLYRQPRPTFQARPEYPAELRSAAVTGEVVVEFVVDANGEVRDARAVKAKLKGAPEPKGAGGAVRMADFVVAGPGAPSGSGGNSAEDTQRPEAAAVAAVGKWRFEAGQKGGRTVNTVLQVPIVFALSKEPAR